MIITCPYCFREMNDDEVHFRSEKIVTDYVEEDDGDEFGFEKSPEELERRFFAIGDDEAYMKFWDRFDGKTTEEASDTEKKFYKIEPYKRKVIDPRNKDHRQYLVQPEGSRDYFKRDEDGLVTSIVLHDGSTCDRRVCKFCHNPFPSDYGKYPVKFATIIGITGAGKTVYLSQLLKRIKNYTSNCGLIAENRTPSVQQFISRNKVEAGETLPGSTPSRSFQQPLIFEISRKGEGKSIQTESLVLYDVAGEVFSDTNTNIVSAFAPFVEHSSGIIVLIDPDQFADVTTSGNAEPLDDAMQAFNAIRNAIPRYAQGKFKIPCAVCVSKADEQAFRDLIDPELCNLISQAVTPVMSKSGHKEMKFNAEEYNAILKGLHSFMEMHEEPLNKFLELFYDKFSYFAVTSLGCDVKDGKPVGPVIPMRIEEPLLWLFQQFGYLGVNKPVAYEWKEKCPRCHNYTVEEFEKNDPRRHGEIEVKGKLFFSKKKKEVTYKHYCTWCNPFFSFDYEEKQK